MSGKIFISYRRDDERGTVGRLLSALQSSFTPEQVFADADPVQPGDDVVRGLNGKIGQSSALVAIIGPKWLSVSDTRRTTRLDNAADVVRVALEAAFRRRLRVVPVLIGAAEMPSAEQLPLTLRPLATLAPVRIQSDSLQADVEGLVNSLKSSVGQRPLPRPFWPAIAIGVALIAVGGSLFVWQGLRNPFVPSTVAERAPATSPSTASPQPQAQPQVGVDIIQDNSKITDRVGQPGAQAPVAARVVLYDEDPSDPQGKQYAGQVAWRTEQVGGANAQPSDIAIRAEVEIPDRKLKMTFRLRRNNDPSLPASHTVDLNFVLAPDFVGGSIDNVPGILMKTNERARGTPLAGLAVKVTDGFFMAGLSSADGDRARNMQLLKERAWFDIPLVYANKHRAIIAMEKGAAGERAFNDAFAAWGQ
ncbi:MAG: toll/interleukin-1 receptor domain-containing protein [Alphaproteobacteria bacterium]|nr:toll/interleukin-1 receptor domain-containing protein [Alphaproteobacteria bacterium]